VTAPAQLASVRYLVDDVQAVDDLDAEIGRLKKAGVPFRSELVSGPGGRQILLADPADNLIELFESAR
jgi:predicted enzyme related to lactoylglutathione lyase